MLFSWDAEMEKEITPDVSGKFAEGLGCFVISSGMVYLAKAAFFLIKKVIWNNWL